MAEYEWGHIRSGATFEALVTALVYFEDARAALFGRRGKDGGQDVRSGDGLTVYQAKHHEDGSAAKAIADAKREAENVKKYRQPGHPRHDQWVGVKYWKLATNAAFNPTDHLRWKNEIEPLFKDQGLEATYWEKAHLEALLAKHKDVAWSFFENDNRVFYTLPEFRERLIQNAPFLPRAETVSFRGRTEEVAKIKKFLQSDKQFLVITGPGGIGKTRLFVEAGDEVAATGEWQVLAARVKSMERGHWFRGINLDRPTLLLVDDPEDTAVLQLLDEQLGGHTSRANRWKVVVAVRSSQDPVLRFLRTPEIRRRVDYMSLAPLSGDAAEAVCAELLASSERLKAHPAAWRDDVARKLSRWYNYHPIWMALGVWTLEEHGDITTIPETADELAQKYIVEIIEAQRNHSQGQVIAALRWAALLGTVNREDPLQVELLVEATGLDSKERLNECLKMLVERSALAERGAYNRLVEVKPDVIRDHILRRWLVTDEGFGRSPLKASDAARRLIAQLLDSIKSGSPGSNDKTILSALARTEFLLRSNDRPVPLLDHFFQGLRSELDDLSSSSQLQAANLLAVIASIRPDDAIEICRRIRVKSFKTQDNNEGPESSKPIQADMVSALAQAVFHAAMGAQTAAQRVDVLDELIALIEIEEALGHQETSGHAKHATECFKKTLGGSPYFVSDFEDEAKTVGLRMLEALTTTQLTTGKKSALITLLKNATELERRSEWWENRALRVQTRRIKPGQRSWETRSALLEHTQKLIENENLATEVRIMLWDIIAHAHGSASSALVYDPITQTSDKTRGTGKNPVEAKLLATLRWAQGVLESQGASFEELKTARNLWEWHLNYDRNLERREVAESLESLYLADELAQEFGPIFNIKPSRNQDDMNERQKLMRAKAQSLVGSNDPKTIVHFLKRAVQFFGSEHEAERRLQFLSLYVGELALDAAVVREFIVQELREPESDLNCRFAIKVAFAWISMLRNSRGPEDTLTLIVELTSLAVTASSKAQLLGRLYGESSSPRNHETISPSEHIFLRSQESVFLEAGQSSRFLEVIGWTFSHDWAQFQAAVESVLEHMTAEQLADGLKALIGAIYTEIYQPEGEGCDAPDKLGQWLLEQLLRLADLDVSLHGDTAWKLNQIFDRVQRPSVCWFVSALHKRAALEASGKDAGRNFSLSTVRHLSQYVLPLRSEEAVGADESSAIASLIDFIAKDAFSSYWLTQCLRDFDPEGVVVASEVTRRISALSAKDAELATGFAKVGGAYGQNTEPWRAIARSVVHLANQITDKVVRHKLFRALADPQPKVYFSATGEVPALFAQEVNSAKHMLERETEADFRQFWQWSLDEAEDQLDIERERVKEDRGE